MKKLFLIALGFSFLFSCTDPESAGTTRSRTTDSIPNEQAPIPDTTLGSDTAK